MLACLPASAVLWDVDGTLLTSGGAVARLFLDAVEAVCGSRPNPSGLDFGGRLDSEIAALLVRVARGRPEHVPNVLSRYESLVSEKHDDLRPAVTALPGARELAEALAEAGVVQTVVTGNLESVGRFKVNSIGLSPPLDLSLGGFGDEGDDRAAVGRVALQRIALAAGSDHLDTCWVIGDTPRDAACAQALGLHCALVASGHHSIESLGGHGADLVLPGLTELRASWFG